MKNPPLHRAALVLLGGCLSALATLPAAARAVGKGDKAEVAVNCELTAEGRKVPRPTPQTPAYYVPVIFGYHENGRIIAGEAPPLREELIRQIGRALAKEGYVLQALRPNANTTTPALIITFEWGYLNPVVSNHGALDPSTGEGGTMSPSALRNDPTQAGSTDLNQNEMIALVAGAAIRRQTQFTESDWARLRDAVAEDRYFIVLCAYDFQASLKGEQELLWQARMSTQRHGVWINDIVPALVAAGAPVFGRQTDVPRWTDFPVRDGKVILGDLKVIDADVKLPAEAPEEKKPYGAYLTLSLSRATHTPWRCAPPLFMEGNSRLGRRRAPDPPRHARQHPAARDAGETDFPQPGHPRSDGTAARLPGLPRTQRRRIAGIFLIAVILMASLPLLRVGSPTAFAQSGGRPSVVLRGDYPDLSILRDGDDSCLTHLPFPCTRATSSGIEPTRAKGMARFQSATLPAARRPARNHKPAHP